MINKARDKQKLHFTNVGPSFRIQINCNKILTPMNQTAGNLCQNAKSVYFVNTKWKQFFFVERLYVAGTEWLWAYIRKKVQFRPEAALFLPQRLKSKTRMHIIYIKLFRHF